jgi:hypothetical protein
MTSKGIGQKLKGMKHSEGQDNGQMDQPGHMGGLKQAAGPV